MKTIFKIVVVVGFLGVLLHQLGGIQAPDGEGSAQRKEQPSEKSTGVDEAATNFRWAANVMAIRALRSGMKDPDSFEVEQVLLMESGMLCLTYRARNSFNALVLGRAVLGGGVAATSADSEFISAWNKHCGGKTGDDITYIRRAL